MENATIIVGKIHALGTEEKVSESSSVTKQNLVVVTEGERPQHIPIDFINGKCGNELAMLKAGDPIKVTCNITGREYDNPTKGKQYFLGLAGWKVESDAIKVGRVDGGDGNF